MQGGGGGGEGGKEGRRQVVWQTVWNAGVEEANCLYWDPLLVLMLDGDANGLEKEDI